MRIGNNHLVPRKYVDINMRKIEMKSKIQDVQYGYRLSKGTTFEIGSNDRQRFFITVYPDCSFELWTKRQVRSGFVEETVVCLTPHEVECMAKVFIDTTNPFMRFASINPDQKKLSDYTEQTKLVKK